MNSAAELRRFNNNQAFLQAKDKITKALEDDPLGLSISQLMTICKLSIKTVKEVVLGTDFKSEDGVFFLANKEKIQPELVNKPQEKVTKKVETVTDTTEKVTEKSEPVTNTVDKVTTLNEPVTKPEKTFLQRIEEMFLFHPEGVTLGEALEILECDRKKFDSQLWSFKKKYFNVELKEVADGIKRYVPCKEPKLNKVESDLPSAADLLKSRISTVVTRKSQLSLDVNQLKILLSEIFGLDDIQFWIDHGQLTGVYLVGEVKEEIR
ncbi:hypothetical protein ACDW34_06985 [Acinetobacter piscicola]|uniref:hypothetical protein n=1 Tax=Acinetobacter piscicola TaxID=2006115 RepID=UPI003556D378